MMFYLTNSLKPYNVQFIIIYDEETHKILVLCEAGLKNYEIT